MFLNINKYRVISSQNSDPLPNLREPTLADPTSGDLPWVITTGVTLFDITLISANLSYLLTFLIQLETYPLPTEEIVQNRILKGEQIRIIIVIFNNCIITM